MEMEQVDTQSMEERSLTKHSPFRIIHQVRLINLPRSP